MIKFIIIAAIAWLVGVFGWAQIIGSLQNLDERKGLLFTLILWAAIMGGFALVAISKFNSIGALALGYAVSFIQVKGQGNIE